MKIVFEEILVECDCKRRYMRIIEPRAVVESGVERCLCGRKLGEWSGMMHHIYEPEIDGFDA